jgi:hypothetical protein
MLAAAGLGATWVFRKVRILAIFDDLDTVLLMIPLKMMMIGIAWQLGIVVLIMVLLLASAWIWLHSIKIPSSWNWVMVYSLIIGMGSELVYKASRFIDDSVPIHIEVLLPAFVLGCVISRPEQMMSQHQLQREHQVATIVSAIFMVLVGLSMPAIIGQVSDATGFSTATILGHVLVVTLLSNLGKMFPVFCYRAEAHWRERLAVALGMWPRGEVGAGVLVISLSYGIGGQIVTVAMLSLVLNLCLTGLFIYIVQQLIRIPEIEKVRSRASARLDQHSQPTGSAVFT